MGATHGEERGGKQGVGCKGGGTGGQAEDGQQTPTGRQDRTTLGETRGPLGALTGIPSNGPEDPGNERERGTCRHTR